VNCVQARAERLAILPGLLDIISYGQPGPTSHSHDRGQTDSDWRARYEKALQQIEKLKTQTRALETSVETERAAALKFKQAAVQVKTELDSLREKANTLAKNVFTLGAERDQLTAKLESSAKVVHAAKLQINELKGEFQKSKDFYTAQIKSAVEQRQLLESKIDDARHEQKSLNNLLRSSKIRLSPSRRTMRTCVTRRRSRPGKQNHFSMTWPNSRN
jgi:chromosome segregation ATPase